MRQPPVHTRVMAQRREARPTAVPLTTDAGVVTPPVGLGRARVAPLRASLQAIDAVDRAMAPRAPLHPDCALFPALLGAGSVFAPRLLVACGAPRERAPSAPDLPPEAGRAPVTERSGTPCWVHGRLQGPMCLRQTCVAWASAALRHACWARAS